MYFFILAASYTTVCGFWKV